MGGAESSLFCATTDEQARARADFDQHKSMACDVEGAKFGRKYAVNFTSMNDVKPSRTEEDRALRPIWWRQMTVGTTHAGCVLAGTVIGAGIFTGGIYFLLEDTVGGVVKVGVYNIPNACPAVAAKSFPEGRTLEIVEPYLKVGSDGRPFIRIEQPSELRLDVCLPDASPDAWQQEGKQLFTAGQHLAAIECWDRALAATSTSSTVAVLLTNRAAALLQCSRAAEAVCDTAIALVLDPQPKAACRLVAGLISLGFLTAATPLAVSFARRWPNIKPTLEKSFRAQPDWDGPSGSKVTCFWEDERIISLLMTDPLKLDDSSDSDATWESLKAQGNSLFRSGAFESAVNVYSFALHLVDATTLVKLLTNKAAAFMQLDEHHDALLNAMVALGLDPTNVKSWHRRASALLKMDRHDAALIACKRGRILCAHAAGGGEQAFETLEKSIAANSSAKAALHMSGAPEVSTAEQKKKLDELHSHTTKQDVADAGTLAMMNAMMIDTMPAKKQIKIFGCKVPPIPPFHKEFPKHCGWPNAINVDWAKKMLLHWYEQSRALPYIMQAVMSTEQFEPAEEDLMKRANGQPERLLWLMGPGAVGDICPEDVLRHGCMGYPTFLRQSFSNQAYRREMLHLGTVHVAVGFVDLGVLLSCVLGDAPTDATRGQPLQFVGVELSVYAVAKSLVVWQMIKQASSADAVLQVWYSATWDTKTEPVFRKAVSVARSQSAIYQHNADVSRLLNHWVASKGVSLSTARAKWASNTRTGSTEIAHMVNLQDRLEMAAYELTGDAFTNASKQLCGSICWWDCPDGTPPPEVEQKFLSAVDVRQALQERALHESVISACQAYLRRRVVQMMKWARAGSVTVGPMLIGNVNNFKTTIAALKPWTMSWSNVLDYMAPREFHALARACSIHGDTVHFAYSMNWSAEVKGSQLLDYPDPRARKDLFTMSQDATKKLYKDLGWLSVFRCPPPDNPMNAVGFALAKLHYRNWINHWFESARATGSCQLANLEPAMWNPLSKTGQTTVLFTFTYDPEVTFNAANTDSDNLYSYVKSLSLPEAREMLKGVQQMDMHDDAPACERQQHVRMVQVGIPMLKARIAALAALQSSAGSSSSLCEEQD